MSGNSVKVRTSLSTCGHLTDSRESPGCPVTGSRKATDSPLRTLEDPLTVSQRSARQLSQRSGVFQMNSPMAQMLHCNCVEYVWRADGSRAYAPARLSSSSYPRVAQASHAFETVLFLPGVV
jgi:hypothetical protein